MKRRRRPEEIKQQNWKINVGNVSRRFPHRTTFMSVRMDISTRKEKNFTIIRYSVHMIDNKYNICFINKNIQVKEYFYSTVPPALDRPIAK